MSATNWQKCCDVTLDYEGGNDDDPRDPGGRTSRGITQSEYNVWRASHPGLPADVWVAPQATIVDIYKQQYWDKGDGDDWPAGVDLVVYDANVNSGLGAGLRWARATLANATGSFAALALAATASTDRLGIIHRYQARRLSFLHALRTWSVFGRGWGSRVAGIEAIAIRMAQASLGQPVAPVLQAKADAADKQSKAAGAGSAAGAGASAAHAATAAPHTWVDWIITGGVVILTALLVAYLLHVCYVQAERSKALKAESLK